MEIEDTEVWTEVEVRLDGVSVTLYSETEEGYCVVEDETWLTMDELQVPVARDTILD